MDNWIAGGIEEDFDLGVEKWQTFNNKRNDRRKQTSCMGNRMNLSGYCNFSDDCCRKARDNESFASNLQIRQNVQETSHTATSSSSLTYKTTSLTKLHYEESNDDDDDSDDELYPLDAFDSFVKSDSSEDDEDDEVEVLNEQQQVAGNDQRLHYYTGIRLFDACRTLWLHSKIVSSNIMLFGFIFMLVLTK